MKLERIAWENAAPPVEAELRQRSESDGFSVTTWHDPPGRTYAPHSHDHDESLWCVAGRITFMIGGRDYVLDAGDRLMLPRGTVHAARAGERGARYLIGERE